MKSKMAKLVDEKELFTGIWVMEESGERPENTAHSSGGRWERDRKILNIPASKSSVKQVEGNPPQKGEGKA